MEGLADRALANEQHECNSEESFPSEDLSDDDYAPSVSVQQRIPTTGVARASALPLTYNKNPPISERNVEEDSESVGNGLFTINQSIPESIDINGQKTKNSPMGKKSTNESRLGLVSTPPTNLNGMGLVPHMRHLMHGYHDVALENNSSHFQKSFIHLWCKFEKMDAI